MSPWESRLAIIGTPVHWALVALVAVALFAPRLIPVIARLAGRMVGREVQRRYGVRLRSSPRPPREPAPTPEPIHVESLPDSGGRASPPAPSASEAEPVASSPSGRSAAPVWPVAAVVGAAAAVLLWLLLHTR